MPRTRPSKWSRKENKEKEKEKEEEEEKKQGGNASSRDPRYGEIQYVASCKDQGSTGLPGVDHSSVKPCGFSLRAE